VGAQTMPEWAGNLLKEIESLKHEIRNMKRSQWDYYDFIHRFRRRMMPDPNHNHFPEVVVGDRRIGVTLDGLLYDKSDGQTLNRMEAFKIYTLLYRHYRHAIEKKRRSQKSMINKEAQ